MQDSSKFMKILVACDGFKDSLDADGVASCIREGLLLANPSFVVEVLPLADGGEGTSFLLTKQLGGELVEKVVQDPLGRPVTAWYGIQRERGEAYIELAQASGLERLDFSERNPLKTSTFGTGELILDAYARGVRKILLGIGGSATNDVGMGMAEALGYVFLDSKGRRLAGRGENLGKVRSLSSDALKVDLSSLRVEVMCDVVNPLLGLEGAARVYSPQKGASAADVEKLELGALTFSKVLQQFFGMDFSSLAGAGAAGGMGAGSMAFLGGKLRPGAETILDALHFEERLKGVAWVITGEGSLDQQTFHGKTVKTVSALAAGKGIPVLGICGSLHLAPEDLQKLGLAGAFSICRGPGSLEDAILHTRQNLTSLAFSVGKMWV